MRRTKEPDATKITVEATHAASIPASHSQRVAFAGEEFKTVNAIDDGPAKSGTANGTKKGSAPEAPDSDIGPAFPR